VAYDAILRNRIIRHANEERYRLVAPLVAAGRSTLQIKAHASGVVDLANRLLAYLVPAARKAKSLKRAIQRKAKPIIATLRR
jgi:hypothetical protein